jgi:hypothetical protein
MNKSEIEKQKLELMPIIKIDVDGFSVCQTIAKPLVSGSCRHEWKYNRTINVKVCTKCNYAENYSDLDNYR